jgi:hypothetical protein
VSRTNIHIRESQKSKLGNKVGQGQCSEVFLWEDSKVCKLFLESMSLFNFENEYNVCIAAMSAGIPVPLVHGAVRIENRLGIIFDRIEGRNMDIESALHLWKLRHYINVLAELQNSIHKVLAPNGLKSQHELLEEWISRSIPLPKRLRDAAVNELRRLPEGHQLCHGDYHLGNVILSPNGPAIIDWQTANAGNPLGDIAATEIVLLVPVAPPILFHVALPVCRKRAAVYRQHCQVQPWFDEEEYRIRLFVVTASRISNVLHSRLAVRYLLKIVESQYNQLP